MNTKKILVAFAIALMACSTTYAQGWQIGGQLGTGSHTQEREMDNEYVYDYETDNANYADFIRNDYTFVAGYVNKTWRTDFDGYSVNENFWGERDKRLHGMQVGFLYQPSIDVGFGRFGFNTGLCYELYLSVSPVVKDAGYDRYVESDIYIPLHATYSLPLARKCSLNLYGGIAMNWAIDGEFQEDYEFYDHYYREWVYDHYTDYQEFGNGRYPRHFNGQIEYGASLKFNNWSLGFTYSQGLTNHKLYKGFETIQNKMSFNITYTLPEF